MLVKDPDIFKQIEKICIHYRDNVNNRFLKKAFSNIDVDSTDLNRIEYLKDRYQTFQYIGFDLHELYEYSLALALFVFKAREDIVPCIRNSALASSFQNNPKDGVLFNMAVNNLKSNVDILSDYVQELYFSLTQQDKLHNGNNLESLKIPDLEKIGSYLVKH